MDILVAILIILLRGILLGELMGRFVETQSTTHTELLVRTGERERGDKKRHHIPLNGLRCSDTDRGQTRREIGQ